MRILFLGDCNSAHIKRWLGGLIERDIILGVFTMQEPELKWYREKNISLFYFENPTTIFNPIYKQRQNLKNVINDFKPDIVHAHGASNYGMLGRLSGFRPFIISVLGNDAYRYPKKSFISSIILRKNLYEADAIVVTGETLKNETVRYTRKPIEVISYGIDAKLFHPIEKPKSDIITIGMVKSIEDIYGVDLLIDAFTNLYSENNKLRLLMVGGGSKLKHYKLWVESIGLEKVVRFTGPKEMEELPLYFSAMDICVYPVKVESFGVAVLEASACAKPVIASDIGGISEVVIHNETGILLKNPGVLTLEKELIQLIENKDLRIKMGEKGRLFVIENYAYRQNVDKMIALYLKVISKEIVN